MARLFGFPFRFGNIAATPSVVTEEETAGRWTNISATAKTWQVHTASLLPRFEHVRWGLGRQEWNGCVLSGQLH